MASYLIHYLRLNIFHNFVIFIFVANSAMVSFYTGGRCFSFGGYSPPFDITRIAVIGRQTNAPDQPGQMNDSTRLAASLFELDSTAYSCALCQCS